MIMLNTVGVCLYGRQRRSYFNLIINALLILVAAVLVFEIYFNIRYRSILVDGRSMLPTLVGEELGVEGDYIYVDTLAKPARGDIVVMELKDKNIIKRVIALGGDTVKLENGKLYIKYAGEGEFVQVEEPYVDESRNDGENSYNSFKEHTVAEGYLFLLGDNRNESSDSRLNGDYSLEELFGVAPGWALENKSSITALYSRLKALFPAFY